MRNGTILYSDFIRLYSGFKELELNGRYITYSHIEKPFQRLSSKFRTTIIGQSTLGVPIKSIFVGSGKIKILAWSQMHGNESTTTKAVFDLLNGFYQYEGNDFLKNIMERCTLQIIPMLNPDGAKAYTRENANKTDLNRDAKKMTEIESQLLRSEFDRFQPDFCFNLHGQRTIFSAGDQPIPATLSFLTPAMDQARTITASRIKSMRVIAAIVKDLQEFLPKQIGRYDDAFNDNCTGDSFQSLFVPTILFEAGHYKGDYQREKTREFVVAAMFSGLNAIASGAYNDLEFQDYFEIPENKKLFYDVILRDVKLNDQITDVAIQFKEVLTNNKIEFVPIIEKIAPNLSFYGHKEIDCGKKKVSLEGQKPLGENVLVSNIILNNEVLAINCENN
ncbi:MAG: peptidase M14 [Flavobacteriaceae bacterium]|nr:peptidase M14 [Flavobacteriaceae bacterium]